MRETNLLNECKHLRERRMGGSTHKPASIEDLGSNPEEGRKTLFTNSNNTSITFVRLSGTYINVNYTKMSATAKL